MKTNKNINKFLLLNAYEKTTNDYEKNLLNAMNYNNLSNADISFLNHIVYNDSNGVMVEEKVIKQKIKDFNHKIENLKNNPNELRE